MKNFFVFYLLVIYQISVAQKVYINPQFKTIAENHTTIAILPFQVTANLRPEAMKKMTASQLTKLQKDEGMAAQSTFHGYLLRHKTKHNLKIDLLDLHTVNALLLKNDITENNFEFYTPHELCTLLQVDGVVTGQLFTEKPFSEAAAIAHLFIYKDPLFNFNFIPTNTGNCIISMNDGNTGALLWKYNKSLNRGHGSSTYTIINAIMRKASRKFPYKIKP
jgi:hypothetical protein